ncbi:indolepyruvate oxidoreductase subunit beta [Desulfovermiculus halophilus]|jgi:indolepyruvate ferredoxin oxidoreductase beta subunit|uniref:indolepyruvate oxidoreductase subunit beta n=1 Tax=Desulfovermiculus halophilus TaxID=339722 RepID=UPI0004854140|nr:indolepyruvate oxidoreductase subunit beta [Desulfovermiculus halophilus]
MKSRVFLAGVGGQGTLTATNLLGLLALDQGIEVCAGEIHGMAQRGGVVESALLLGGYMSPKIAPGEASILLGFEPLETLRALPYLRRGGVLVSNSEPTKPVGVSTGWETYPDLEDVQISSRECAGQARFVPCKSLAAQAGTVQCANMVLLGALCAAEIQPFTLKALHQAITSHLPAKIVDINLKASQLGFDAAREQ